jgi:hypothetical protein
MPKKSRDAESQAVSDILRLFGLFSPLAKNEFRLLLNHIGQSLALHFFVLGQVLCNLLPDIQLE